MVQSLLIKAAMLAATVALILWIGWPTQQDSRPNSPDPTAQALAEPSPDQAADTKPAAEADTLSRSTETNRVARQSKLDINRATIQELQALPGIGGVLAQRVVEYRRAHGPFQTVEGLKNVKGIGPKRMGQLRPLLIAGMPEGSRRQAPQPGPGATASGERKGL